MEVNCKINRDVILALEKKEYKFETKRIPIKKLYSNTLLLLHNILNDKNKTALEMQHCMEDAIRKDEAKNINYIYPEEYSSSYVSWATFPSLEYIYFYEDSFGKLKGETIEASFELKKMQYDEYMQRKKEELYQDYDSRESYDEKDRDSYILSEMISCEKKLKEMYLKKAEKYIQAFNYKIALDEVLENKNFKFHSSSNLGWKDQSFEVTNNVNINVHTNFGYGLSSYFYICLKYKNIWILPYSFIVKYYYANTYDIRRYTFKYETSGNQWEYALKDVEKAANLSISDEVSFFNQYIVKEVDNMMVGLREIVHNPLTSFEKQVSLLNNPKEDNYCGVRYISESEVRIFKACSHEVPIVYLAKKLLDALNLLEELEILIPVYGPVKFYISEIKEMALSSLPEIKKVKTVVEFDVERLAFEKERLRLLQESVASRLSLYSGEKELIGEYVRLLEYSFELHRLFNKIDSDYVDRLNLLWELNASIKGIDGYDLEAA